MKKSLILLAGLLLALLATGIPAHSGGGTVAYLPLVTAPQPDTDPVLEVEPQSREASRQFFLDVYLPSEGAQAGWSGNHNACDAGGTAQAFRDALLLRLNYFRAMAGVPALDGLNDEYNHKAQQAALMMSANGSLSHTPPAHWRCYTEEGAQAAGSSNLFLGVYGPAAIDGYVRDPGGGNYPVGHRRWILYPPTRMMGSGDVPPADGYPAANALWVFDADRRPTRPATREPYVAWPPPGYVPYQVVFPRWSLSYPGADFEQAAVSMTHDGAPLSLAVRPVVVGYGENTLVWEPQTDFGSAPAADVTFTVTVSNVLVDGAPRSFAYSVVMYDPQAGAAPETLFGELGPALRWR
ncbi:MAG TPA: CAP domain-containing protein [Candidatus Sulfomarinibacteraceae bacterium]|nr:CAP domain-containing protein [Candidatus Sulfomarinibacteraceae bacterium]